jgi:hypothetical protein
MHGLHLLNAAQTPRFYETKENMQPSALDGDFNSFIEPSFRHAAPLLSRRGIRVVNLLGAECAWERRYRKGRLALAGSCTF